MAKILFLAHRVPFPPDKGDKIRAFHLLRGLAERHELWLGAGADELADLQHLDTARQICRDAFFAPLPPMRRRANFARGLLSGAPLSVARFHHAGLARWVDRVLAEVRPEVVFVFSSAMAQYVAGRLPPGVRLIVDFVDADAEKWREYALNAPLPLRAIYAREFRRLMSFERRVLDAADTGLLVSATEKALLAKLQPQGAHKLQVVPNGVDVDYFAATPGPGDGRTLVFCGRMDYPPNVEAVQWFARDILPMIRRHRPDVKFSIVGSAPTSRVRTLAELPGVEVTGPVPDVRPHLAGAAAVVAPLRLARGVQNKVLEAMAAARPTIVTPQALDGVDAVVGRDVLAGADEYSFASAVLDVLAGACRPTLGLNARAFVLRRHQWSAQLAALERLLASKEFASAEAAA